MSELRTTILEAVARGWCTKENENKVVDTELGEAITDEVVAALATPAELVESHDIVCAYCVYGPADDDKHPCSECYGGTHFEGRPVVFRDEEEADHE